MCEVRSCDLCGCVDVCMYYVTTCMWIIHYSHCFVHISCANVCISFRERGMGNCRHFLLSTMRWQVQTMALRDLLRQPTCKWYRVRHLDRHRSMGTCCAKGDPGPDPIFELRAILDKITKYYPGTCFICLLNHKGHRIVEILVSATLDDAHGFVRRTFSARKAAIDFSRTFDRKTRNCSVLHLQGESKLATSFCFNASTGNEKESKSWILAFYSAMPQLELDSFDIATADEYVKKKLIPDMKQFISILPQLQNSQTQGRLWRKVCGSKWCFTFSWHFRKHISVEWFWQVLMVTINAYAEKDA